MNDWASRISRHMTAEGAVVVNGRIASWLERQAGMTSDRRICLRGKDAEMYEVIAALHVAALAIFPESERNVLSRNPARHTQNHG